MKDNNNKNKNNITKNVPPRQVRKPPTEQYDYAYMTTVQTRSQRSSTTKTPKKSETTKQYALQVEPIRGQ